MNGGRVGAYVWAISLVGTGVLLLFFNFGLLARFEPLAQYLVAGCFVAAGVAFFGGYLSQRSMWWRLIPGWTLLSVAAMVLLSTVPGVSPLLIPAALFVGLALAFGNIYLVDRANNWWAIIPGGFLLVLSVVMGLNTVVENLETLFAVLLIGMGLVFLLLAVLGPDEVQWWPLVPGLTLVLFGLFLVTGGGETEGVILRWWPVVLIVIGLGMGWRAAQRPQAERLSVNVAPGTASAHKLETHSAPRSSGVNHGVLGDYLEPAPGASVEILSDDDEEQTSR